MNTGHSSKDQDRNYPCKVWAGGNKAKKSFSLIYEKNLWSYGGLCQAYGLPRSYQDMQWSVGMNSSREIPELRNDCFKLQVNVVFWYPGLSGASLQESSAARCSLFGNDHIKTFDGSLYGFAGDCSYLLAGDCHKHSFTLVGESELGSITGKKGK